MAIGFNIQFRIDEKLSSRVIRLTDTSTGFTLSKGNFSIVFPDGTSITHTDFLSPDINTPGGIYNFQAPTDIYNNVLVGTYRVTFVALSSGGTTYTDSKEFDFNWVKPVFSTINKSDVFIPEVKFQDATSYSPIGSFAITGSLVRTFSVQIPSNSEVAPQLKSTSAADLNTIHSGKYYEGLFNVNTDVIVNYTNSSYSYLTLYYTALNVKTFDIRQAPTQLQIVTKMNAFRSEIDAYKEKNDTQFEILSEDYDIAIALYSHLIARYQTGTLDGSQPIVEELLSILEPYGGTYTYKATQLTPFSLDAAGSLTFIISDGTTTDSFAFGETLTFTSNSSALLPSVSNNTVSYNPVFGTSANTFVQGNDSRLHSAVTIGTSNGLSLASQALSLAAATTSTPGAMSAADKLKLDGIAAGANTGTVTSITVTAPSAFTVSGGTITTTGTIAITGAGTASNYIKGDGSLGVFNTDVRGSISLTTTGTSGAATYSSTTGILNIPQYQGGVTSFNTRTGAIVLSSGDITTALTFTPENTGNKGIAGGYASLDGSGLVPSTQLPSFVDDVLEYADLASLPATGTTGKIYVTLDTNKIYRWNGSSYIELSSGALPVWGAITGTLSNQTDLNNALSGKQDTITLTTTGTSGAATLVGATLNIPQYQGGVTSFNTRSGAITLTSGDVTTALTFTPYNATNPSNYIALTALSSTATGLTYTNTTGVFSLTSGYVIPTSTQQSNWNTAYGWGNHASAGYLTSFTEADPVFLASAAYGITNTNISNWNTAYGWGNHASAGYLTSINSSQVTNALGYTPENAANKGIANGYASLDGAGLVPSTQLPSYVDDVLEYADLASLPATGATGKIYVTLDTNKIYRWSGTVYVEISSSAGGGGTWGSIIGTLSNQTDLQAALDAKQNSLGFTPVTNARTLTINGVAYDLTANRSWTVSGTMPSGGTAGQILSKIDATDYNTQWIDNYAEQVKHSVKLGATIAKGKAVYVSSADGTNMIVSAASNASESTSSKVLGLLETGGVTNDIVKVVTEGLVAGLDTSTATAGDPVWLGTSGNLIFGLANKPVAPAHLVFIGVVTRVQSNNGEIFVNVQNGFEIEELHNVLFTSKADKDLMYYDNATSLWKNAQLATVLGYTPANDSTVVHIAGAETITGTKTFRGSSTNETPTLGANVLSSSGWATGVTGWTGDYTNGWTVVGSGSSPMTNTQAAASNTFYVLSVTATTSVSGKYLSITFGGGSFFAYFASTGTQTVNVEGLTTSTGTLSISASGFDGTISAISFKTRNSTSLPIATFASSTGLNPIDVRADNVSSSNNMFIGFDAGKSVYLTANSNLGIGYNVLKTLQNGIQNIGIGSSALNASITGSGNIGIGVQALSSSISGQFNIAIGTIALSYNKASYNVAIGSSAAYNNTTGTYNVALGFNTMYGASSSTAAYNTALGAETLYNIASNSNNVAVGYRSLYSLAGSNGNNVSIGYQAGRYISGGSTAATDIANSIFIGHSAYPLANGQTNQIVIGHATVGNGSNTVTIGNSSITANYFKGSINGGSFVKSGGTSSQFLKADGSVDSSTYLTSFTETDPIYTASSWYTTTNNASNWDTAYGWGNHASAGYLTTSTAASTYQPLDDDLTAIAGLAGTSGFLKKTAANTWSLDTSTYLTSISSSDVTTALGYTPVTNARTLTINGTAYDLSADRSWTISAGTTLNGTGFVKASGTTISYDNSTYLTASTVLSTPITGYSVGSNTALAATDTILGAFNKIQGQINARLTSYTETSTFANVTARGATSNSSITVNGYLTVRGAGSSSSIYMSDDDEGQRELHCNSNRIGFLTQGGGWGSYCNDDGSWVSVSDITAYSDARVKENIITIDNALDKVLNLRGVSYNRIDSEDKNRKIGVIAQETQLIVPEVVQEQPDGMLGVSYGNMAGLFIEAIKEQQKQIEDLKKIINDLTK